MIFLPLTVAATVLSGVSVPEPQAASNAAIETIAASDIKVISFLCTSFTPQGRSQIQQPCLTAVSLVCYGFRFIILTPSRTVWSLRTDRRFRNHGKAL